MFLQCNCDADADEDVKLVSVPTNWVCNVRCSHCENGVCIGDDSADYKTIVLKCLCLSCLNVKLDTYVVGDPVSVSKSYPYESLVSDYIGLYVKDKNVQNVVASE